MCYHNDLGRTWRKVPDSRSVEGVKPKQLWLNKINFISTWINGALDIAPPTQKTPPPPTPKGRCKRKCHRQLVSELRKLDLKMWVGPESQIRFWPNSLPHGQLHASSWTTEISQIIFFWQIYSSVLFFDDTTSKGWTFLSDLTANSRIFILEYCEEISHMKKKQLSWHILLQHKRCLLLSTTAVHWWQRHQWFIIESPSKPQN